MTLDSCLTLNKHVSVVCSAASLHIRNIGKIRHLLTQSITEKLVHAFITARLDYCNSILYGLPKRLIQRLQRIQDTAARLMTRTNRYDHITPVLKRLHWRAIIFIRAMFQATLQAEAFAHHKKNIFCRRKTKLL